MKYKNLPDLFYKRADKYQRKPFIRYRQSRFHDFKEWSWSDTSDLIAQIAHGLRALGVQPKQNIGLLSATCHYWLPCDFAIMSLGAVTVPLYHSSTSESVRFIVEHAELEYVIVRNKIQLQKLRAIWNELPNLKYVIVMIDRGDIPTNDPRILTLDELCKIGEREQAKDPDFIRSNVKNIDIDDIASIIYTSGTTGTPKGVTLSHRNFLVAALSFFQYVPLEEGWNILSFLPLAHVFERVGSEIYGIDQGVIFTYCEKVEQLPRMMQDANPQMMCVVPRLLEKVHAKVMANINKQHPVARMAITKALELCVDYQKKKLSGQEISAALEMANASMQKTVLSKIKNKIAPDLKIFVVGGAPFSTELSYFYLALGFDIVEGYGLTETSAPITVNPTMANRPGTVGLPFSHFDVKVAEDGEIICKGDAVFQGYYKRPDFTSEVLTEAGWFHTGDIGEFDADGYLKITGRKKDIIITAGGKNVAPARVEDALMQSKYLSQVVILGDREKYLAALVSLNLDEVAPWARENGIEFKKKSELIANISVQKLIEEEVRSLSRQLASYEQVKAFHILDQELSIDGGELTPTLKVKRNVVREKYQDIIQPLFQRSK